MQSFFIASGGRPRENGRVNQNNLSNSLHDDSSRRVEAQGVCAVVRNRFCRRAFSWWKKLSRTEKVTLPAALLVFLAALIAYVMSFSEWTTAEGRGLSAELPWRGHALTISSVSGSWRPSAGNARISLRAAYYPEVKLSLSSGDGELLVRFRNGQGAFVGDPVTLRAKAGRFLPSSDRNVDVDGATATVSCEMGFARETDYRHHALQLSEPLWSVAVWERRPDDSLPEEPLGRASIQP